jgi:hypothetical protein
MTGIPRRLSIRRRLERSSRRLISRMLMGPLALALLAPGCLGASSSGSSGGPAATHVGVLTGLVAVEGSAGGDNGGIAHLHTVKSAPVLIIGVAAGGGRIVRHSKTDPRGRFRVTLPSGRYTVDVRLSRSAPIRLSRKIVTVRPGKTVRLRFFGTARS